METVTKDTKTDLEDDHENDKDGIIHENYALWFGVIIIFEIVLVFLALIQVDGGLFNGGLAEIGDGMSGAYFRGTHLAVLFITLRNSLLLTLMVFIGLFAREHEYTQRFAILPTIIFAFTLTRNVYLASNNLVFMFFTVTYIPAIYWYYLKFGEVRSFMDNRVVIFSLRRTIAIVPMFLAISLITFLGINTIGDPVEIAIARVRFSRETARKVLLQRYGLVDDAGNRIPVMTRYFNWLYDFIHGDLGISYEFLNPVSSQIGARLWETLKMQVLALTIAFIISVILGMMAAYYHKTAADSAISATALLGLSMPIFVSGILAILIFSGTGLGIFPASGAHSLPTILVIEYSCTACSQNPGQFFNNGFTSNGNQIGWWLTLFRVWWVYFWDTIMHLVLPVLTLAFAQMATYSRLTRSTMLEVMRQDYIMAARANGLSERTILSKHALRNVLLPLVTFLGINIGTLLAGAPITETVFSWPGLGKFFITSLGPLDIPILMALTMIITLMILFANLITDITYTYLDPRIEL